MLEGDGVTVPLFDAEGVTLRELVCGGLLVTSAEVVPDALLDCVEVSVPAGEEVALINELVLLRVLVCVELRVLVLERVAVEDNVTPACEEDSEGVGELGKDACKARPPAGEAAPALRERVPDCVARAVRVCPERVTLWVLQ